MSYSDLLRGTIAAPTAADVSSRLLPLTPQTTTKVPHASWYPSLTSWTSPENPGGSNQVMAGMSDSSHWYRNYRNWSRFLGGSAEKSFGYGTGGTYDPIVALQQALSGQIGTPGMATPEQVRSTIGSQVANNQRQLSSYGNVIGAPDAVQGMIMAQSRLRQTMADRAVAQYMPQAWAQNEQFQNEIGGILSALARADYETAAALKTTGRNM